MKTTTILSSALALLFLAPAVMQAQDNISNFRAYDQSGINVFEPSKDESTPAFDKIKVKIGAGFTQQFQDLEHSNTATKVLNTAGVNTNELIVIGSGFNTATANLNLDVQLADGIRMNMISYLSSRHHNETWVKGGYVQIDRLPMFDSKLITNMMKYVTLKIGHSEINYGDAHFRRSDNGNALYNPFIGNYMLDAFTTEIGGEAYLQYKGLIGMVGLSGGEIKGSVTAPETRSTAYYFKAGVDKKFDKLRVRLTGSTYLKDKSQSNTLYRGDRAGSRYYLVMENTLATTTAQAWSGSYNPGFSDKLTAYMVNPFIKFYGVEFFGTYEYAKGRSASETLNEVPERYVSHMAGELVYRFLKNEQLFVGGRYETVKGTLSGITDEVKQERFQYGAGWFITPNLLMKGEYVTQKYFNYPSKNILNGGEFSGFMVEAVVGF